MGERYIVRVCMYMYACVGGVEVSERESVCVRPRGVCASA